MIRRYLARRNNPWELLIIAAMVFVPGVVMVSQRQPMVAFPQAYRGVGLHGSGTYAIEIISPHVAHIFGVLAIAFSALIVVLYFWARQAIARDPGPHVVEHGHSKSSD
jgi:hypothetical protein